MDTKHEFLCWFHEDTDTHTYLLPLLLCCHGRVESVQRDRVCEPQTLRSLVSDPLQKACQPALHVRGNTLVVSPTSTHYHVTAH